MNKINSLEKYLDYNNEKIKEEWKSKSDGEKSLINDYIHSRTDKRMLTEYLVIEDIVWEKELEDYLKALKKYKINKFVYADTSTACFRTLLFFLNNGAKITTIEFKEEISVFGDKSKREGMLIEI